MAWTPADVEVVRTATFRTCSFLKRGYDMEEVDDLLDEVVDCMRAGRSLPPVAGVTFSERSGGYHPHEVDAFLAGLAVRERAALTPVRVSAGGHPDAPAGQGPGARSERPHRDRAHAKPSHPLDGRAGPTEEGVSLTPVDAGDEEELVAFLCRNTFPFHASPVVGEKEAMAAVAAGRYRDEENRAYWVDAVDDRETTRLGLVVLEDLQDDSPMFDLRLADQFRGRGYAVPVVRAITRLVFTSLPDAHRFEGHTRADNVAMRRTFLRCGFVKEGHYRQGWPTGDGTFRDTVAYGILRSDWLEGTTTPVTWEDLP